LSRSVPPDNIHDIDMVEAMEPPVVAPAVVPPAVAPAVEPVAPAVEPAVVPPVVAPAVLVPAVVDMPAGSTIALVSMYRPSAAFATHPVTVTSCPAIMVPLRCVVGDVVVPCAPSEITQLHTPATHSPVILRVIRMPSS
jgi:hypothetical protein